MRIEPKQAFYNEDTGAVQPWKDIEVTDAVGNALVAEGLVTEIEGGGGGGSNFSTAQMTVNTITGSPYGWSFPVAVAADEPINGVFAGTVVPAIVPANGRTFEVVLYKGAQFIFLSPAYVHDTLGAITYDYEIDAYKVTGDCAITLYSAGEA